GCAQPTASWRPQLTGTPRTYNRIRGRSKNAITIPKILVGEAKVAFGLTRKRIFSALTIALFVLGAFTFGFVSSLHLKNAVSSDVRKQYLLQAGDAPLSVRAGVLAALRDFQ